MANKNSRTKNSILSLVTGIGGQLLNEVLRFITRTVFIFTLGKMFLGINGLFAEIMTMLSLTNLGVGTAIIYRLYKPIAENDEHQVRVLLKFYKKAYQAIGVVILALGLCLLPFLKVLIKDYDRLDSIGLNAEGVYLMFLAQSVVSYFFFAYRNCVFAADQKQYVINGVNIVTSIITAIIQIAVLYLMHDFILYLLVGIIDNILKNVVISIMTYKHYPSFFHKEKDSLPHKEVKSMFKDCGALMLYRLNAVVQQSTGNFIISAFIGLAIVGMYSNYLVIYAALRTLTNQLFSALRGSMGNLFASNSSLEDKYSFFEIMNFMTIIVFGTIAVVVIVNMNELIYCWLGEEFVIDQPFPLLLGLQVLIMGLALNLNQIRNVTGLFRQMWTRPILSMVMNLVVTLIAVQFIGVYAIPLGYIISVTFTNLVVDPFIIHKNGFNSIKPIVPFFVKNIKFIAALVTSVIITWLICSHELSESTWTSFICHTIIAIFITNLVIIICFHRRFEYRYLFEKISHLTKW